MNDNKNNIINKYISTAFFMLIIFASVVVITPAVSAAPTKVISVPWQGDINKYHATWSGQEIILKGVIHTDTTDQIWYKWNFGDGTPDSAIITLSGKTQYNVEIKHTYTGAEGTPFTAKLIVADNDALVNPIEDPYLVMIQVANLDAKINVAIDNGLWFLYKSGSDGSSYYHTFDGSPLMVWSYSSYYASPTASAVHAFEINGHKETGNPDEDPYVESVKRGLNWLFNGYYYTTSYPMLQTSDIGLTPNGDNPDTNANGKGIGVRDYGSNPVYESGMVMDAIVASGTPDADSGRDFDGDGTKDTYREVLQDMADMYAWGQTDSGSAKGGWRYSWNGGADNSISQWAAIGMIPAQEPPWNVVVPQWVKTYNNLWTTTSYKSWISGGVTYGGFGYADSNPIWGYNAVTPSGMVQLAFSGQTTSDSRWVASERWLADNWNSWRDTGGVDVAGANMYAYYAFAKAMRLAKPEPVVTFSSNNFDWYRGDGVTMGLAEKVANQLVANSYWNYYGTNLGTAWSVIILRPVLFQEAPIACFDADPNPSYPDKPINFNPSCSGHSETGKDIDNLKLFEWDWDNNGVYEESTATPQEVTHSFSCPAIPCTYPVKLKVTDDNDPARTATYVMNIVISNPPHPPVANAGGLYFVSLDAEDGLILDGSKSYDPNEGEHEAECPDCPDDTIAAWNWDLNGAPWDYTDKSGEIIDLTDYKTYFPSAGSYNIGLLVRDRTATSYPTSGKPDLIDEDFTVVHVFDSLGDVTAVPLCNAVTLSWANVGADSYDIYRSFLGANEGYQYIGSTTDTTKTAGSFVMDKDHWYRIMAVKGEYESLSKAVKVKGDPSLCNPTADPGGPYEGYVGETITLDGSGSTAKTGVIVTWEWDLDNDGEYDDAFGETDDMTWDSPGIYTIGLQVTSSDSLVLTDEATTTVTVILPIDAGPDATIKEGETFSSSGTFGAPDTWTATVNYGDGSEAQALVITDGTFVLSHLYADDDIYTVTVTATDGTKSVSDTATVTVKNVAPTVAIKDSYFVTVPVTLRIAGQGKVGNSVALEIIQDGNALASDKITRTPGSPNEQEKTITATIDLSKPYSGRLQFDTETAFSGGTPVWVIIDGVKTKITTFNTQKSDPASYHQTYDFELSGLVSMVGKEISFTGSAIDPGADDMTFDWLFGDGGSASMLYPWPHSNPVTETVKHTYSAAGSYTVKLDVTDDDGGVGSASKTIVIS